jgi:hypothetical protein
MKNRKPTGDDDSGAAVLAYGLVFGLYILHHLHILT